MSNCLSCRYWLRLRYQPDLFDTEGSRIYDEDDVPVEAEGAWGQCERVAFLSPNKDASDKFYVQDASEYSASLYTRSDFGCVEHHAR